LSQTQIAVAPPARGFQVESAGCDDLPAITALYREVGRQGGGLARRGDEITEEYVAEFVHKSLQQGIILVARQNGSIIGEIHCYSPGLQVFAHVFGALTVVVHPQAQSQGVGRALFQELLARVQRGHPEILRIELVARESNLRAIQFYEKLGFRREGRFENRIRRDQGGYEADIPLAWLRMAE